MEFWELVIVITGALLSLAGIIGCLLPFLPGPPLNYIAILLIHFTGIAEFSTQFLITFLLLNIAVIIFDYILPVYGAKNYGASRKGIWGSIIGLIVGGFVFPPFGIIIGALVGAVIGELIAGKSNSEALRTGFATFVASILMIAVKLILAASLTFYYVQSLI